MLILWSEWNLQQIFSTFSNQKSIFSFQAMQKGVSEAHGHKSATEFFKSNIGSPQGGSLSGKLFNVYFEYALKPVREFLEEIVEVSKYLPPEAIYADDADFITQILKTTERQCERYFDERKP